MDCRYRQWHYQVWFITLALGNVWTLGQCISSQVILLYSSAYEYSLCTTVVLLMLVVVSVSIQQWWLRQTAECCCCKLGRTHSCFSCTAAVYCWFCTLAGQRRTARLGHVIDITRLSCPLPRRPYTLPFTYTVTGQLFTGQLFCKTYGGRWRPRLTRY